jgi:hypothetical protein
MSAVNVRTFSITHVRLTVFLYVIRQLAGVKLPRFAYVTIVDKGHL